MRLLNRFFVLREVVLQVRDLVKKNAELRARAEKAETQLAGCSAAALGWDLDTKQGEYGWSAAYGDVVRLRRSSEAARALVVQVADLAGAHPDPAVLIDWVRQIHQRAVSAGRENSAILLDFQIEGDENAYDVARRLHNAAKRLQEQLNEANLAQLVFRGSASDLATDVVAVLQPIQRNEFLEKFHARVEEAQLDEKQRAL